MTIKPQKNQPNEESLQQDGTNQNNTRITVAENQVKRKVHLIVSLFKFFFCYFLAASSKYL